LTWATGGAMIVGQTIALEIKLVSGYAELEPGPVQ
jgi:hypothetical protein